MKRYILYLLILLVAFSGCKKEEQWLDQKPDKALLVPASLQDMKALLNNEGKFNVLDVSMGFMAGEPYYIRETVWTSLSPGLQKNVYTWNASPYEGGVVADWNNPYSQVYYCNVVLDGLKKISVTSANQQQYNEILGTALFFRSYAYYKLLYTFAPQYSTTSLQQPGIILLESADVSAARQRSTVEESYNKVISDLLAADTLLPAAVSFTSAPTRTATKGLLARIYLSMQDYTKAFDYADKVLTLTNTLIDFNTLNATATYPVPRANSEDLFHSRTNSYTLMLNTVIDSNLYKSYAANDLRKIIFFNTTTGFPVFKGSYEGASSFYSGIATNEILLIRAETNARAGRTSAALQDLNNLLVKRYKTGTYINITATSSGDALTKILAERKKELLFRGLAWTDLKRLNTDASTSSILTRTIAGQTYTLPPNDLRYVFLLPDAEVLLSNVNQNPR